MSGKRVVIIGGGVGGLAAACLLAKAGHTVTVVEKNEQLGGRCSQLKLNGFTFDTGPSWYLMPEMFARFFAELGEDVTRHLNLVRLQPAYRVFYKGTGRQLDITGDAAADEATFEHIEPGAGQRLQAYLARAAQTYRIAANHFLYQNYDGASDLARPAALRQGLKLPLTRTLHSLVGKSFTDPRLQKLLEYSAVFLGVSPFRAPAIYSLLSHADFTQGVQYPLGGMYELVLALVNLGRRYGVTYRTNAVAEQITVRGGQVRGVVAQGETLRADIVVSDAGVQHTESALLHADDRDHSARYWRSRTLAPSALLLYLGINRRVDNLAHHNLIFSHDWRANFAELAGGKRFPADPSLYICAPGKTDASVAPSGCENLCVLVPVAAGLEYTDNQLTGFTTQILQTLERELHAPWLRRHIVQQRVFCVRDFAAAFNSPFGTGLGLAHTLRQSAVFRPRNISRKVRGLYYVGADVHPGIGLPTTLISAQLLIQRLKR